MISHLMLLKLLKCSELGIFYVQNGNNKNVKGIKKYNECESFNTMFSTYL